MPFVECVTNRKEKRTCVFFLLAMISFPACMSSPRMHRKAFPSATEEKIALLTQQLDEKDAAIEQLQRELKRLKKKEAKPDTVSIVLPSVPVTKVGPAPTKEKGAAELKVSAENEVAERAIADSRFETMHLYFQGLDLISASRFEEAIAPLTEFLKANPEHVYADRAEFLIGQAYFLNKEYELAALSYSRLQTKYSYSLKMSQAIYQRGLSYLHLGEERLARGIFRDLIRRFPKDPWAKKATTRLNELATSGTAELANVLRR